MEPKQNPFSLYDFLGYFTPGAVFLFVSMATSNRFLEFSLHQTFKNRGFTDAEVTVGLIILAYIIGHALSLLSSILVEKFSIWMHGYPSKYLLCKSHCGYLQVKNSLGKGEEIGCKAKLIRILVWIFMAPVAILDKVIGEGFNARNIYVKQLDRGLGPIIRAKMRMLLEDKSGLDDTPEDYHWMRHDFFRFGLHYALIHSEHHIVSIKNYVALYGFTRTMTLLCILIFWGSLGFVMFSGTPSHVLNILLMISGPFAYIYYMAFNKFNRRYTLEVLMAVAVHYDSGRKLDPKDFPDI